MQNFNPAVTPNSQSQTALLTGTDLVNSNILKKYPCQIPFQDHGGMLGLSPAAAYVQRSRGDYPVRVRKFGGRLVVFTSDHLDYLRTGESQAKLSVKPIHKACRVQVGRPSKRETLDAAAAGLTVKQLRAQKCLTSVK